MALQKYLPSGDAPTVSMKRLTFTSKVREKGLLEVAGQDHAVDVDLREVYFLIMHFLSSGPCQRTCAQLWNELLEHQLLPRRYHAWFSRSGMPSGDEDDNGLSFPLCYNQLVEREPFPPIWATNKTKGSKSKMGYVDTLLDLQLPEDQKRKLEESEMVSTCSEFLDAGTDSTAATFHWILPKLVNDPNIQQRLVDETREAMGEREDNKEVKQEDLKRLPYLKALILEGLRRHPPAHFALAHAVTEDVVSNDYLVPKKGPVNFMLAEIGRDPEVWEDPMEFKLESFLNNDGWMNDDDGD